MAHLRILQIVREKGKGETIKLLPGEFNNDRECQESLKKSGSYIFLEVHTIGKPETEPDATEED